MRTICKNCPQQNSMSPYRCKGDDLNCEEVMRFDEGYEQAIEKACEWWKEYLDYPTYIKEDRARIQEMIDDFRKAMQDV